MGYGSASSCSTEISVPTLNRYLLVGLDMSGSLADQVVYAGALLLAVFGELLYRAGQRARPIREDRSCECNGRRAGEQQARDVEAVPRSVRRDDRGLGVS